MQRSHILVLDSNDRLNPDITNANDCRLQIRPAIGGFDKIELLSFTLPIIQYNITASNNTVYFNIGGTDYIATLPDGCYTYLSLPPLLQTQLEAVSGGTFVVQYDELTFKIVVTITSA